MARQLTSRRMLALIECAREVNRKYGGDPSDADREAANFVACLHGALRGEGYAEVAAALANAAAMSYLNRDEGAPK